MPLLLLGLTIPAGAAAPPPPAGARPASLLPETVLLPSRSPIVSIRVLIRTGSVDDPAGKEGLASLTTALVREGGTTKLPYEKLLRKLAPMAATIDARCDKEVTVIEGTVHRDHLSPFFELFRDVLFTPGLAKPDFERVRSDARNALANGLRGSDDEGLGKAALELALYRGHPYGHLEAGTVQSLGTITLEDVVRFHRSAWTRDRVLIGIAGGYPANFPSRLAKEFLSWAAEGAPKVQIAPAAAKPGRRVTIVEKPGRAVAISWGFPIAINRSSDDFFALMVANSYLGEHRTFNGVLMNRLRGIRGLNYGDYSYIENFIQDGGSTFPVPNIPRSRQFFSVWLRPVRPENAPFALRASLYHLETLVRDGIPEEGFEATRAYLLGYSRLFAQSTSRRLGYRLDSAWYGREDFLAEIERRLPKLTKADVDEAIRKYLRPENVQIALVAPDAPPLADRLAAAAPTPIVYDTTGTAPEVLAEDDVIASWPLGLDRKAITIVPVGEMFEK
jgi:zinc protease